MTLIEQCRQRIAELNVEIEAQVAHIKKIQGACPHPADLQVVTHRHVGGDGWSRGPAGDGWGVTDYQCGLCDHTWTVGEA